MMGDDIQVVIENKVKVTEEEYLEYIGNIHTRFPEYTILGMSIDSGEGCLIFRLVKSGTKSFTLA